MDKLSWEAAVPELWTLTEGDSCTLYSQKPRDRGILKWFVGFQGVHWDVKCSLRALGETREDRVRIIMILIIIIMAVIIRGGGGGGGG